ncbi:hypothetical protein LIER_29909 [Lithospermum erythrorhizon]|uniref:FAS1 domain-containing protein n=1 Tax=Lithospermum erythrorhizon TaxID=34254 RepID=A0AAV3RL61_LITER
MIKLIATLIQLILIYKSQKVITITHQLITKMDNFMKTLLLLSMVFASVNASDITLHNQNILEAIEEMQKANYFTFIMLLNIAPPDLFAGNVTFLMPTDSMLAKATMPDNSIVDFLLRHTIPSPLLFDHLIHFPTGSLVPTSSPDLMLKVTNNGRQSFFLNNVRIRSPNICTSGSSIRCHGIDGVLQQTGLNIPAQPIPFQTTNSSNPPAAAPLPAVSPPTSTTDGGLNPAHQAGGAVPPAAHLATGKQTSGSHRRNSSEGSFQIIINVYLIVVSFIICFT